MWEWMWGENPTTSHQPSLVDTKQLQASWNVRQAVASNDVEGLVKALPGARVDPATLEGYWHTAVRHSRLEMAKVIASHLPRQPSVDPGVVVEALKVGSIQVALYALRACEVTDEVLDALVDVVWTVRAEELKGVQGVLGEWWWDELKGRVGVRVMTVTKLLDNSRGPQ